MLRDVPTEGSVFTLGALMVDGVVGIARLSAFGAAPLFPSRMLIVVAGKCDIRSVTEEKTLIKAPVASRSLSQHTALKTDRETEMNHEQQCSSRNCMNSTTVQKSLRGE